MGVFGMQWNMIIITIITHTLNRPFSCVVTAGQLTGYPHAFLKKRRGYCNRLRPSVRPSVRLSFMLSPPKPLDEIQPNLLCELLT